MAVLFSAGLLAALYLPYGQEILVLNSWRTAPFNAFFRLGTFMGESVPYIIAILISLFWRFRHTIMLTTASLMILPYAYWLKDIIRVQRPLTWFRENGLLDQLVVVPHVPLASGFTSFPSGHTMAACTLYTLLAMMLPLRKPVWGFFCAFMIVWVGCSRIFLAQHFLRDVLAGVVFSWILVLGLRALANLTGFQKMQGLDSSMWVLLTKSKTE
ncbi:MAG: phosphatase PAP2 family protein [Bacteroidetes bacterium]|nr:phosphatase PAP2 family protein [Bacteroidota bacterium]